MNKAILFFFLATFAAVLLTGCACKQVPAQHIRNMETAVENADYFHRQAVKRGDPEAPLYKNHADLIREDKRMMETNNKE